QLRVLVQRCSLKIHSLMAGVRLALEKLSDDLSGALELRLVGMSDDLVHPFNAQAGLRGQIINDGADNAAQGREFFQHRLLIKISLEATVGYQVVTLVATQHPFWGDVSLPADAKRRTD